MGEEKLALIAERTKDDTTPPPSVKRGPGGDVKKGNILGAQQLIYLRVCRVCCVRVAACVFVCVLCYGKIKQPTAMSEQVGTTSFRYRPQGGRTRDGARGTVCASHCVNRAVSSSSIAAALYVCLCVCVQNRGKTDFTTPFIILKPLSRYLQRPPIQCLVRVRCGLLVSHLTPPPPIKQHQHTPTPPHAAGGGKVVECKGAVAMFKKQ